MSRTVRAPFPLDTILPPQFFATLRSQTPPKPPEYRLLIAVLGNAIECFQKYVRAKSTYERQSYQEAEEWIMGANQWDEHRLHTQALAFSFSYVCEALGIDPSYLRQGLQRWRDARLTAASAHPNPLRGCGEQKSALPGSETAPQLKQPDRDGRH